MVVVKRDGRIVQFDSSKIVSAVLKAFDDVDEEITQYAESKAEEIAKYVGGLCRDEIGVESIQDIVERKLMASNRKDVAKAYILYRDERNRARERNSESVRNLAKTLAAQNVANQNANMDERSFGGRIGSASSQILKKYALDHCMSAMARNNHLNNEVYIHDLDHYSVGDHNCLSVPFDKLLENGFNTRQTDVRPAQSVNTAFQLVAVIFQLQSLQQFGGVSATHLDWTMVPYVRKSFWKHFRDGLVWVEHDNHSELWTMKNSDADRSINDEFCRTTHPDAYTYAMEMTERETRQAVEAMYHNLNTLQSRSGNQLPFTSVNYGTCTLPEGRMVTKALLDVSIKGIGKLHKTSIFPCGIFQCMKGVNREPGDPNYDLYRLALESTSLRLYPNYANVDWSGNAGYDRNDPRTYFSTMGCRTANGYDINGFGQLKDGRGNICPVTVIMPTLAMEAIEVASQKVGGNAVDEFMSILDNKIHEAKDMLLERFEYICNQPPESAKFMYENGTMEGYVPEEGIRSALKHGTLALGQIGLAETLQILIGCDHTTPAGMELAKRIEELFRNRCAEFKEKYMLNFGVYYTPECENITSVGANTVMCFEKLA